MPLPRSLRSGYIVLAEYVGSWLLGAVLFEHPTYSPELLYQLWTLLGVESSLADMLVELGVHWRDGHLMVLPSFSGDAALMERLSTCILSLLSLTPSSATPSSARF